MTYTGGCHCGRIAFAVEGDIEDVIECNCSICAKRGYLLWFAPREQLHLATPESDLASYTFGSGTINHHFCAHCGSAPFGMGTDEAGKIMVAVNVRCLDDIQLTKLNIRPFDGRSA